MKTVLRHIFTDKKRIFQITFYLCSVIIFGEVLRDIFREGDFGGYISAGKLAWNNLPIYSDYRNTWPPFFSIVCIPLYWLNELSFVGLRLTWLISIVFVNLIIFRWTISYFTPHQFVFNIKYESGNQINLYNPLFILPFILTLRIFLEEISNLQINLFILALSIYVLHLITHRRDLLAGIVLAFIISIKIYPILILGFLIFKQKYKSVFYTLIGIIISTMIVFMYFGLNTGIELFREWNNTQVVNGLKCEHMNQSIWGWVCGLTTQHIRIDSLSYSISNLSDIQYKFVTLILIGIFGMYLAVKFYLTKENHQSFAKQYIITLSLIPIISPLAWKYYYVFLTPLIILLIYYQRKNFIKPWFYIPLILITLTSELFIGHHLSDVTEAIGVITFCSLGISIYSTNKILNN